MYSVVNEKSSRSIVDFASWTDEDLLLEYRLTQERQPFEELVHRYERELFNYLRHYLGNAENAEDVFQATFMQVHLKCGQFESGRVFRPWLYRIATNQAIDHRRRNRRHMAVSIDETFGFDEYSSVSFAETLVSDEPGPTQRSISGEQAGQVREAVEQLPDILKQVLYLVYFQGMKYQDAAESLEIPFGTVKSRLHAAVKKLNSLLAETDEAA